MHIENNTPFPHGFAIGLGPKRRLVMAFILKATYDFPDEIGEKPVLSKEQIPVLEADEFDKGDVTLTPQLEAENVPFKPKTDLILIGKAYAPKGQPKKLVDVLFRVGNYGRVLRVFGDRKWIFPTKAALVPIISDATPFTEMPIIYERAFGGIDKETGKVCEQNIAGVGFIGKKMKEAVHEKPLPNIEDPKNLINSWDDTPNPVGYGYFGRGWKPRVNLMGVYTGKEDPNEPIQLPENFDSSFYNGAHPDLQVSGFLKGDETVELRNLTPEGHHKFNLPNIDPDIRVKRFITPIGPEGLPEEIEALANALKTERVNLKTYLDTLIVLPEKKQFCLIWRAMIPLRAIDTVEIGGVRFATK